MVRIGININMFIQQGLLDKPPTIPMLLWHWNEMEHIHIRQKIWTALLTISKQVIFCCALHVCSSNEYFNIYRVCQQKGHRDKNMKNHCNCDATLDHIGNHIRWVWLISAPLNVDKLAANGMASVIINVRCNCSNFLYPYWLKVNLSPVKYLI